MKVSRKRKSRTFRILFLDHASDDSRIIKSALGVTSEKNRRFKDIHQIGKGRSSSHQKFKIILISDIFLRGEYLSMKMKSVESLPIKERITVKRYQN